MIEKQQDAFINYEIWILVFGGGFQRAGVYSSNADDKTKKKFRAAIKEKIISIVHNKYETAEVSADDHIKTLLELKGWIDSKYSSILADEEIKLGIVQKLINLYLKYQWCLGLVCKPPHCPFDRIIISKMKLRNPPAWTRINSVETYKMLVNKVSELADGKSIAEWELDVFSRR
jgi:hypothetical protein